MSRRKVIAYAITHAPPGVKGGPYEGPRGAGWPVYTLAEAWRRSLRDEVRWWLGAIRETRPHARVIRIVRAPPSSPSEASAIAVLRELVAWDETPTSCGLEFGPIADRARRVLAGAGPDPMRVVGAALRETEAEEAFSAAPYCGRGGEAAALDAAARARVDAVDAYRKAGGK